MNKKKYFSLIMFVFVIFGLKSHSQAQTQSQMFVLPVENKVYVYHTRDMAVAQSFHVYRQDQPGAEFERITDEPIGMAGRIDEVAPILGEKRDAVFNFFEVPNETQLWMAIQNRPIESSISSLLFPEAALIMGRLFIDSFPPMGNRATYRIDFLDFSGQETGEQLTTTVDVNPVSLPVAQITRAQNQGRRVNLHWDFDRSPRGQTDFVMQFYILRKNHNTGRFERVTDNVVIRNNATSRHSFTFESPVVNASETYVITAVDFSGRQGPKSEEFTWFVEDNIAPEIVEGIEASLIDENSVGLSWIPSSDPSIAGYNVYRGTDMTRRFQVIHEEPLSPETTFLIDTTIVGGLSYFYYVTAVSPSGLESEQGSMTMVNVPDLLPPPTPQNFAGEFDLVTMLVNLSWEMEEFSDNFRTFVILRRRTDVQDNLTYTRITFDDITSTTYTDLGDADVGFIEGAKYQYVLYSASRAYNFSDTLSITVEIPIITPPDPPSQLRAVNDNGHRINLSWNPSLSRNLAGYRVYRKETSEDTFRELAEIDVASRLFRDEVELTPGNEYVYVMKALDIAGNESEFSEPDTLHFRTSTPPPVIRNLQAAVNEQGVELRWDRVGSDNLAGYRVFRSNIATGRYVPVHDGLLTETAFFDTQGTPTSWYRVRAVDTSGNESRPGESVRPVVIP